MTASGSTPGAVGRWSPASVVTQRPGLVLLETRVEDFDVRSAVVLGRAGALVWDTLAHPTQMAPVSALVGERPVNVAYSHADWDHVWGTGALGVTEEVLGHEVCASRFQSEVPGELEARRARQPEVWEAVALVPPSRAFVEAAKVDLGDVVVELRHLPGHTGDCCVAWIPAWGVLLAGDTVETPLPVVNDPAAVPTWAASLRRWAREPALETVVPSHGPVGGAEALLGNATYLETLMRGRPPTIVAGMSPFYLDTHRQNLAHFGLA